MELAARPYRKGNTSKKFLKIAGNSRKLTVDSLAEAESAYLFSVYYVKIIALFKLSTALCKLD